MVPKFADPVEDPAGRQALVTGVVTEHEEPADENRREAGEDGLDQPGLGTGDEPDAGEIADEIADEERRAERHGAPSARCPAVVL